MSAELLFDLRVRETRADGAVEDVEVAPERRFRLADHEGRAAHAFDAAGDKQVAFADRHRMGRGNDRAQPACAIALQHLAGNALGQSAHQQRVPQQQDVALGRLTLGGRPGGKQQQGCQGEKECLLHYGISLSDLGQHSSSKASGRMTM